MWKYFFKNLLRIFLIFALAMLIAMCVIGVISVIISFSVNGQLLALIALILALVIRIAWVDARDKCWAEKQDKVNDAQRRVEWAFIEFKKAAEEDQKATDNTVYAYATFSREASNFLEVSNDFELYSEYIEQAHNIIEKYGLST